MSGVSNNSICRESLIPYNDRIQKRRSSGSLTSIILSSPETHKHRRLSAALKEVSESYSIALKDRRLINKTTQNKEKILRWEDERSQDLLQMTKKEIDLTNEENESDMENFLVKFGDLESEEKAAEMEALLANFGDLEPEEI